MELLKKTLKKRKNIATMLLQLSSLKMKKTMTGKQLMNAMKLFKNASLITSLFMSTLMVEMVLEN